MQAVGFIILFEIIIYLFIGITFHLCNRKKLGLHFSETDKCVFLNGENILNLRSCSMNYRFIKYLFNNSNRVITEKELEENVFFRDVYVNKLVSNIKFPTDVRESVFTIENRTIIFSPLSIKKAHKT